MPKVSVIIPAYNAMAYLPEAIESVLQQTYDDFEVIVVNDGSSDNTAEWVAQVADPRVKLISQENKGVSSARNTGITHAQGKYIAFLDSDDLWEPDKLSKQAQILDGDRSAGLVYTWVSGIDKEGKPTGKIRKNNPEGKVWDALIQHNIIECGSVPLVRRECLEKVGLFDESLRTIEDLEMWLRLAAHYPFRRIPEALVYYRERPNSLSINWPLMEECFVKVLDRVFADTPSELLILKSRSYALAYLSLSWKPIQSEKKDYRESVKLLRKAIEYDPSVKGSREYWRLLISIKTIQYMGEKGYANLFAIVNQVRKFFSALER